MFGFAPLRLCVKKRMTTTPLSELDRAAADFRNALLRRDDAALKRLMAAYRPAYTRMQARVAALTAQIATAQAAGETVRPSWLVEQGRLETLQRQIVAEWARFAAIAEQVITDTQRAAVEAASADAQQLTLAALDDASGGTLAVEPNVTQLHPAAMQDLVGVLSDGSPLKTLLDQLGVQAAQNVGDALTHAIAVGQNPRKTARNIRHALSGDLHRALTIARTEHLRAYRTASLRNYQENSDILRGWLWRATSSRRTCPVCLAMDGTEHGLDDPFASHQCCRCCPVPLLRDRETPPRETGAEWFAKQDAATQRQMLGPGKHKLYAEGKLTLADLVGVKEDARWGRSRYQRSLREIQSGRETPAQRSFHSNLPNNPPTPPDNLPTVALARDQVQSLRGMERIRAAEMAIVDHPVEYGFGYDRQGNVVINRRGEAREFKPTDKEARQLQGGIFTHNHPRNGSFSKYDVLALHRFQPSELRVIGRGDDGVIYRYITKPNTAFFQLNEAVLRSVLLRATNVATNEARKRRDQFSTRQATARWHLDRVMRYTDALLRMRYQASINYVQEVVDG